MYMSAALPNQVFRNHIKTAPGKSKEMRKHRENHLDFDSKWPRAQSPNTISPQWRSKKMGVATHERRARYKIMLRDYHTQLNNEKLKALFLRGKAQFLTESIKRWFGMYFAVSVEHKTFLKHHKCVIRSMLHKNVFKTFRKCAKKRWISALTGRIMNRIWVQIYHRETMGVEDCVRSRNCTEGR